VDKSGNIYYSVGTQANALIDFRKKNLSWVIRFSPHYFNTFEEIDEALDVVSQLK
jgi:cysteine desulfurase / selenocysteine lyase